MNFSIPVPNTYDKIIFFAGIFVVSFIVLIGLILLIKKIKSKGQ